MFLNVMLLTQRGCREAGQKVLFLPAFPAAHTPEQSRPLSRRRSYLSVPRTPGPRTPPSLPGAPALGQTPLAWSINVHPLLQPAVRQVLERPRAAGNSPTRRTPRPRDPTAPAPLPRPPPAPTSPPAPPALLRRARYGTAGRGWRRRRGPSLPPAPTQAAPLGDCPRPSPPTSASDPARSPSAPLLPPSPPSGAAGLRERSPGLPLAPKSRDPLPAHSPARVPSLPAAAAPASSPLRLLRRH